MPISSFTIRSMRDRGRLSALAIRLDTALLSQIRELGAIEAEQDAILKPARPQDAQAAFREQIEVAAQAALDTADKLISILNEMDGDPDLEDGGDDEPSLGAPEGHASQVIWLRGSDLDTEATAPENRA